MSMEMKASLKCLKKWVCKIRKDLIELEEQIDKLVEECN